MKEFFSCERKKKILKTPLLTNAFSDSYHIIFKVNLIKTNINIGNTYMNQIICKLRIVLDFLIHFHSH